MSKQIMYSLRIDKKIINKAKKEAKKLSMATSAFIRQAIIEKMNHKDRLDRIEKRLDKLENTNY
ncbi:unnamed protein product [marine sediment metagenome]|uniref:Uncharacterized protein n=1 Tax=marine sediment metagenome TaxID=412755 RepID=X1DUF2_9ZZZZ